MKVKLYIKNQSCSFGYYLTKEFPCAPRVGEFVSVDWEPLKESIIENDDLFDYLEYLRKDLAEWYVNPKMQKTKPKPTKEQLWEGLSFDDLGKIDFVMWVVKDDETYCEVHVGNM